MASDPKVLTPESGYPVVLQLAGRRCVVVGSGPVGLRKSAALAAAGAETVLISPEISPVVQRPGIEMIRRNFEPSDLDNAFLAFAATNVRSANRNIAAAAAARGIPVNIADDPAGSDFILPASFSSGHITVAVTTGGASPAISGMVRDALREKLGDEWSIFLEIAATIRERQLTTDSGSAYNLEVLHKLVEAGILAMIACGDIAGIDHLLKKMFGKGYSLAELDVSLSEGSL